MDLKICHRLLRKVGRGRLLGDEVQDERGWSSTLIQQNEHWSGASGLHITEIPWISMALKRLVKPFSKINVVWQPKENSRWFKSIWSNITHHPWSNILHLFFIPRLRMVYFFMLSSLLGPHEFLPPDIKQPELNPAWMWINSSGGPVMGGIDRSGELLINFFQFYARDFDWRRHAVSMRRCARDEWDVGCRTTCPTSGLCWTKASSKEKGWTQGGWNVQTWCVRYIWSIGDCLDSWKLMVKGSLVRKLPSYGRLSWLAFSPSWQPHHHLNHHVNHIIMATTS